jgi:hypothetical protein
MRPGQPGRFLDNLQHNCLRGPIPNTLESCVNATQNWRILHGLPKMTPAKKMFFTPAILK